MDSSIAWAGGDAVTGTTSGPQGDRERDATDARLMAVPNSEHHRFPAVQVPDACWSTLTLTNWASAPGLTQEDEHDCNRFDSRGSHPYR